MTEIADLKGKFMGSGEAPFWAHFLKLDETVFFSIDY